MFIKHHRLLLLYNHRNQSFFLIVRTTSVAQPLHCLMNVLYCQRNPLCWLILRCSVMLGFSAPLLKRGGSLRGVPVGYQHLPVYPWEPVQEGQPSPTGPSNLPVSCTTNFQTSFYFYFFIFACVCKRSCLVMLLSSALFTRAGEQPCPRFPLKPKHGQEPGSLGLFLVCLLPVPGCTEVQTQK